ncbi:MAG: OmpA family protein [Deferrisomatales bacterium]|nr:OmpA family protein [Deferrisomatales bacterium]
MALIRILFEPAKASLPPEEQAKLKLIGEVLMQVLPCYTAEPPEELACSDDTIGKLEAVFIEGHTDNVPMSIRNKNFNDNWELSAMRAVQTYKYLLDGHSGLGELMSGTDERLFSMSGYGEGRPIRVYEDPTADEENRRIDLRFIMTPPQGEVPVIVEVRAAGVR